MQQAVRAGTCCVHGSQPVPRAGLGRVRPPAAVRSGIEEPGSTQLAARPLSTSPPAIDSRTYAADAGLESAAVVKPGLLTGKQQVILACACGFCLSNMDKTVFTVAIIPMAMTYGWTPTVAGLVQSSFFYGFLLMQLPGGWLSTKLGGSFVLPRGLAVWSAATATIPFVAGSLPALCATRAVMGAGEAVAPSSIIDMLTRAVPASERASAVSFAFAGLHMGSIVGLLASPVIIEAWGWPALFWTFGAAGATWLLWFRATLQNIQATEPELAARLLSSPAAARVLGAAAAASAADSSAQALQPGSQDMSMQTAHVQQSGGIPYRAFLRSGSVRALAFTHFSHNWLHYTMLSWLPTYFTENLSVDLMHAAQTALLPPIAGIAASAAAGMLGDTLMARGLPVHTVRKVAQAIGFALPAALLGIASQVPCTPENSAVTVACITCALGFSSFSLAGLYCTHGDLSPKYASALLGMTNVAGSLPGIVGITFVGFMLDRSNDWSLALFVPSAVFMLAGTIVFTACCAHDDLTEQFDDPHSNRPFPVEDQLRGLWRAMSGSRS